MPIVTFRVLCFLLLLPLTGKATHLVGGQLEMQAIGNKPGQYRIVVTQYFEDGTTGIIGQANDPNDWVGIFRKKDRALMKAFKVVETGNRIPLIYPNPVCAKFYNLNFVVWSYETIIQLDPDQYNDPEGYYMTFQTGNRNAGITNIVNPLKMGFTFYLEFPSLQQNGRSIRYSSPHFEPINGAYICLGDPFTFPFGGKDADGDELRYSMQIPLDSWTDANNFLQPDYPGPYPKINWKPGFGTDNAIPGSPTLRVNDKTGELSVTATQSGLFVFSVKVEEFRNGQKIGEVSRDFQFLVIDCPPQTTPNPLVHVVNKPKQKITPICIGESAALQATINPDWNYQWRRNEVNLTGEIASSLTVREAGDYSVVVSSKTICQKPGISEALTLEIVGKKPKLDTTGRLCAQTGTVTLTSTSDAGVTYNWYHDSQPVPNSATASLQATQPGRYWATLTYIAAGCSLHSDTMTISRLPSVQATLVSATGQNRICPQASLLLQSSGGMRYVWQKDGQTIPGSTGPAYQVTTAGAYVVTAIDRHGCEGQSAPLNITQLQPLPVTLDSIPAVCGSDSPTYILTGSPAGGEFSGPGVNGNVFSPSVAGVGDHQLTYTVKEAPECAGTVAIRTAVVAPIPTIDLADTIATYKENVLTLSPVFTGNPNQFRWTPGQYLTDSTVASPSVIALENDITYVLQVKNRYGCVANDSVHVRIGRIWVPDAFTPNGDGTNDSWELPGIHIFTDAIVTVFNRWGEVIYRSNKGYTNPFDGTLKGEPLPVGVYAYTLRVVPDRPVLRGSVVLIR